VQLKIPAILYSGLLVSFIRHEHIAAAVDRVRVVWRERGTVAIPGGKCAIHVSLVSVTITYQGVISALTVVHPDDLVADWLEISPSPSRHTDSGKSTARISFQGELDNRPARNQLSEGSCVMFSISTTASTLFAPGAADLPG
jgi:hypothetical protein